MDLSIPLMTPPISYARTRPAVPHEKDTSHLCILHRITISSACPKFWTDCPGSCSRTQNALGSSHGDGTNAREAGHRRAVHVTRRPTSHATYASTAPYVVGPGPGSRASGSMGTRGRLPLLFSYHPSPKEQVNPAQWRWHRRRWYVHLGWLVWG